MSSGSYAARLDALTRELKEQWRVLQASWRDPKAEEFERRFLKELEERVRGTSMAVEHLEEALRRIRRECE